MSERFIMSWKDRWQRVDWENCRDIDIADQLGVSRERVRQVRLLLGKPCKYKGWSRKLIAVVEWLRNNIALSGTLTTDQFVSRFGHDISATTMLKARRLTGFGVLRYPNARWRFVNWELPSSVINELWDTSSNWAACARGKNALRAPKWDMRVPADRQNLQLLHAISNERAAAQRYQRAMNRNSA